MDESSRCVKYVFQPRICARNVQHWNNFDGYYSDKHARMDKPFTITGSDAGECRVYHGKAPMCTHNAELDVPGTWKHSPRWILRQPNVMTLTVITVRHPISWLRGMRQAMYDLECNKMCLLKYQNQQLAIFDSIEDVWNRYMSVYLQLEFPYVIVRYEDL